MYSLEISLSESGCPGFKDLQDGLVVLWMGFLIMIFIDCFIKVFPRNVKYPVNPLILDILIQTKIKLNIH
jgi:hypothetical protein